VDVPIRKTLALLSYASVLRILDTMWRRESAAGASDGPYSDALETDSRNAAVARDMQEQLDSLESQLQEKEQLVSALTERLEQAAEQLDRLHRSGADRAMRVGGGFPAELVEQQKQLVDDLQRAVQQWEDMQPGALLGRIEMQIGDIRDMLSSGATVDTGSHHSSDSRSSSSGGSDIARYMRDAMSGGNSSSSGLSGYEAMKAGLLGDEAPAEPEPQQQASSQRQEIAAEQYIAPTGPEYEDTPLADPPALIDVANASAEDLRQAVEERDSYILYVLQRLRNAESRHYVPNNWAMLESMPAELRGRLEVLEKQLQQTLRTAEIELSLQRAKLGREETRIRHLDEQVQKDLKRSGINPADLQSDCDRDKSQSNRWMRMLGRRKE
jgi:hypothetical protein